MRAQLKAIKVEMRRRLHRPIKETGLWLNQVVRGHMAYYAVPGNGLSIGTFVHWVKWLWIRALRRRSQRQKMGNVTISLTRNRMGQQFRKRPQVIGNARGHGRRFGTKEPIFASTECCVGPYQVITSHTDGEFGF